MTRTPQIFLLTVLLSLASACVTQGTYDTLKAELDQTNKALEANRAELDECNSKLASCGTAKAAAEQENVKLNDKLANLVNDKAQLDASVEEMKAALEELNKSKRLADARIAEFQKLVDRFRKLIDAGKLKVKIVDGRMVVALATDVLFRSGSASLSKSGQGAIREVTAVLTSIPDRRFQVEGHTDNVPIKSGSNWDLASARAISVVKTMLKAGLPPERVSGATYGEFRPTASNDTRAGKAANRRIEIVIVPDLSTLPGFDELSKMSGR